MNRSAHLSKRSHGGFTLVEVIVVLSVILLLTGIAVPMLSSYMEDGRRARAESEVKTIGAAVMSMYKDVGVYPARNGSGTNNFLYVLYTGPTALTSNPWSANHQWSNWARNAQRGDQLNNHLLVNTPKGSGAGAYATTGSMRWRGPYSPGTTPLDPWGRPYIINVISGWNTNATNYKRMWVVSAGPNGVFDTNALARSTDELGGDDIGVMLTQRQ
ncbi:MAG: prepilin-type N-terminal cleavage/methylation domain-containing protein [Planctomycetes bacterium]|nr:prepilin-type N-terminal cleavage/methylation domain-containing protein [Planctomycetota bacterium]